MALQQKQRVLIVQDREGVFLHGAVAAKRGAAAGFLANIVAMSHPRTGKTAQYMFCGEDVLEIQVLRPDAGQFASYLIDQRVQSDGALFVATRVDPALLLLPHLAEHALRWSPLDQILAAAGCAALRPCRDRLAAAAAGNGSRAGETGSGEGSGGGGGGGLGFCDVNDRLGPDELLYRANDDKTLAWLRAKVDRVLFVLAAQAAACATAAGAVSRAGGGDAPGSASFAGALQCGLPPPQPQPAPASTVVPAGAGAPAAGAAAAGGLANAKENYSRSELVAAVGLVAEYLNAAWGERLAASYGIALADIFEPTGGGVAAAAAAAARKRKAAWETAEEDRNTQLTVGAPAARGAARKGTAAKAKGGGGGGGGGGVGAATKKVNTKGMQPIGSFFAKK